MLAYHVTDRSYVKELMKHGFVGKRHSFTRKQDVKLYLKHPAFREFVRHPVVLEVEIPKSAIIKKVRDRLYQKKSAVEIITRAFKPASIRRVR